MDSHVGTLSPSSTASSDDDGTSEHVLSGRWDLLGDWRGIGSEYDSYGHSRRPNPHRDLDTDDSEDDDILYLIAGEEGRAAGTRAPQGQQGPYWRRPRRRNALILPTDSSSEDTSDHDEEHSDAQSLVLDLHSTEGIEEENDDDDDDDDDERNGSAQSPVIIGRSVLRWSDDHSIYFQSPSPSSSPTLMTESAVLSAVAPDSSITIHPPAAQRATRAQSPALRPSSVDTIGRSSPAMQEDDEATVVSLSTPGQQESGGVVDADSLDPSTDATNNTNLPMPDLVTSNSDSTRAQGLGGVFQRNRDRIASPRLLQALRRHQRFRPWGSNGSTTLNEPHQASLSSAAAVSSATTTISSPLRAQSPSATTPTTSDSDLQSSTASSVMSSPIPTTPLTSSGLKASLEDGGLQRHLAGSTTRRTIASSLTQCGGKRPLVDSNLTIPGSRRTHGQLPLHSISQPHRHSWWHHHVPSTGLALAIPQSPRSRMLKKHQRPCIFLQAGQEFRGTQNLMNPYPQSSRSSITIGARAAGQMEEWHVKVIVDFQNNDLWTKKWSTHLRTDIDHWKRLEAFQGVDERVIARGAKTGKFGGQLRQRYIFMRWKEKHFVNATEQTNGLTIAGFYYIALRRADGFIEGYYYDRQSTPYQRLCLNPHYEMLGQSSSKFEFA